MAQAPEPTEHDYVYPPPHPRRPLILGIGGIAAALCCPPLGLGLGTASVVQARREHGTVAWGVGAIVMSIAVAIISTVLIQNR
jgi:hypothetical protein